MMTGLQAGSTHPPGRRFRASGWAGALLLLAALGSGVLAGVPGCDAATLALASGTVPGAGAQALTSSANSADARVDPR